eukprot:766778-Hanusia_phi.AAC.1
MARKLAARELTIRSRRRQKKTSEVIRMMIRKLNSRNVLVFHEEFGAYLEDFVRAPQHLKPTTLSDVLQEGKSIFFEEESTAIEDVLSKLSSVVNV